MTLRWAIFAITVIGCGFGYIVNILTGSVWAGVLLGVLFLIWLIANGIIVIEEYCQNGSEQKRTEETGKGS